jgi:hypothetical protein
MNAMKVFLPLHSILAEKTAVHPNEVTASLPRDPLQELQDRVLAFQHERFPTQTVDSKLHHLGRELKELQDNPADLHEWADVVILLLGAAGCRGLMADDLIQSAHDKMDINEKRQWGPADSQGVCHHIEPSRK